MKPILRSPQQGADTIEWLAAAPADELGSGKFWHDRRPRSQYRLPWTRESGAAAAQLWDWAAAQTSIDRD
jgi:dehydrogenase/reductase SDR family member 12